MLLDIVPHVDYTLMLTPYLTSPGISIISAPTVNMEEAEHFINTFDVELGFEDYLEDNWDELDPSSSLCKFAGQLCYLSFSEKRTKNADVGKYFDHIKESGHFSVLEHANFSILLWGVSRSLTHELVRHRHFSFSQVSTRYVGADTLRFVRRPEFNTLELHKSFEAQIDRARKEYIELSQKLMMDTSFAPKESLTSRRKMVNQVARTYLPQCTEAPILVTGNARCWRNFLELRGTQYADTEIRILATTILKELQKVAPYLFNDYELRTENSVEVIAKR